MWVRHGGNAFRRHAVAALLCLGAGCVCATVLAQDIFQSITSDETHTHLLIRRALDDGAYRDAERLAQRWADGLQSGNVDPLLAARAADLLVESLIKNGKGADPATLRLAEGVVDTKRRLLGSGNADYAISLDNLGALRSERGEFRTAVTLHQQSLAIRQKLLSRDDTLVADTLDLLSLPLIRLERFAEARKHLDESQRIRAAHPDQPLAFARTLYLIALLHRQDGTFALGEKPVEQALEIQRRLAGTHPDLARTLQLRGDILFLAGDWAGAQQFWTEALRLTENTLGPEHPLIAELLRWLAAATKTFGNLADAQRFLDRALPIAQHSLAPCHPEKAGVLNDAANIATYDGRYVEARSLYADALSIVERCYGAAHSLAATVVYNQGYLAMEMGQLADAERLHARALQLWSAALGPDHPYVARGLDALAEVTASRGQPAKARSYYERALRIREQRLGGLHPDTAWTLANLATTASTPASLVLALQRLDRAIAIYRSGAATTEPDHFARALVLRGSVQMSRGDYVAARADFNEALAIRQKVFGLAHPLTAASFARIAGLDFQTGSYDVALADALRAEDMGRDHLRVTMRYLPERQAMAYAQARPRGLDLALSVASTGTSGTSDRVYDAVIRSRAVLLDELAARTHAVDGPPTGLAATATSARQRYANLVVRSLREPVPATLLNQALAEKEDAERRLAEQSAAARAELQRARIRLDDVRTALPANSALVSFVRYDRTVNSSATAKATTAVSAQSYAAFVLTAQNGVAFVPLASAAVLESLVRSWRAEIARAPLSSVGAAADSERAYRVAGVNLRRAVWDPIAPAVGAAERVFIVPDGLVNVVSFDALPAASGGYLAEAPAEFHYLSTERDLVPDETKSLLSSVLVVGGPDFDATATRVAVRGSPCAPFGQVRFATLPGAQREVAEISQLWMSAATGPVSLLSGMQATETALKRSLGGHRIVHVATHGFFLGSNCTPGGAETRAVGGLAGAAVVPNTTVVDNPLLLSGLAFAGANRRSAKSEDDGILTAEEIASLDMRGTEWVVLSACDTGLGEIKAGEGVFGLRRAFQIAGVRTVIMSLWSVDDQATRAWMHALYEGRLNRKLDTADAVREASLATLRERRTRGQSTHPFYWAAFIAAGDWT